MGTEVRTDPDGRVSLVLRGDLNAASAGALDALVRSHDGVVRLDLSGVSSIDASGLFAIVSADTRARQRGIALTIVPPPEHARRVFAWTGLDRRLAFVPPSRGAEPLVPS